MKTVDENDLFPYFDMGQQGDENWSKWVHKHVENFTNEIFHFLKKQFKWTMFKAHD